MSTDATTTEVVPLNTPLPAPGTAAMGDLFFDIPAIRARLELVRQFIHDVMILGVDYGKVPGTDNIALMKAGAEKLAEFYGVIQRPRITTNIERWDDPMFFHREYEMDLVSRRTGHVLGTGIGSCNSRESRYRWRNAERVCPACHQAAIIKGKAEYGGGWVCFKKRGGCNAKFAEDAPEIVDQQVGRVENDDVATLHNTIIKMAKKRALVDGIVSITRSAGLLVEVAEDDDEGDAPRSGARGGKPGAATNGAASGEISDDQLQNLKKTAEKSGHADADVVAWVLAEFRIDLTSRGLPREHYIAVAKRLSDPTPLAPKPAEGGAF